MYKTLLCWRYLRSRWIALASIISVTLGVATLIVVNAVMQGFSTEMETRLQGIQSDLTLASHSAGGFWNTDLHMEKIRETVGEYVEGLTPTVVTFAMLSYDYQGASFTRQVQLIGIDPETFSSAGDFGKYLQHPKNREQFSFQLREEGYDTTDSQMPDTGRLRPQMAEAGWKRRREKARYAAPVPEAVLPEGQPQDIFNPSAGRVGGLNGSAGSSPGQGHIFDPAKEQNVGLVLGCAMTMYPERESEVNKFRVLPGDDVRLMFPTSSEQPKGESGTFTIVDLYESKLPQNDASTVFVPLRELQRMRGMIDPTSGIARATHIHIRLKEGVDPNLVRDKLRAVFPAYEYHVKTWRDEQSSLLQAIQVERMVLNILLLMIVFVAGFGILATFYMIVVDKTRDIGILKSLGASGRGITGIFIGYGFSLGLVGSGAGAGLGLLIVHYINEIKDFIGWATGQPIFDPTVYYFHEVPTAIMPFTIAWIVGSALLIALLASVLPAFRAARFHPVEALRYE